MATSRFDRLIRAVVAVTASFAIVGALGMGAFAARWYTPRIVSVDTGFTSVRGGGHTPPAPSGACSEPCNILLLGSDSRSGLSAGQQGEFGTNQDIRIGAGRHDHVGASGP